MSIKTPNNLNTSLFKYFRQNSHIRKPQAIYFNNNFIYTTDPKLFNYLYEVGAKYPYNDNIRKFSDCTLFLKYRLSPQTENEFYTACTLISGDDPNKLTFLLNHILIEYVENNRDDCLNLEIILKIPRKVRLNKTLSSKDEILNICDDIKNSLLTSNEVNL